MKPDKQEIFARAIRMAEKAAADYGEVPVAALVVDPQGKVIGAAPNEVEKRGDPAAHAEIQAMRQAVRNRKDGGFRLEGCTLAVTLEPCVMCAAAIGHFRIGRLLFGAYDVKGGGVEHGPRLFERRETLHRPQEILGGLYEKACAAPLEAFFQKLRKKA